MKRKLRSALSRRRIVLLFLSVAALAILARGAIYAWYLGVPSTLYYQCTERQFCMRCGAQSLRRLFALLEFDVATTSKKVTQPMTGYEPHRCKETSITVGENGLFLSLGTWKPTRWT